MKPIAHQRAEWLRRVHQLSIELRRPPIQVDVQHALGVTQQSAQEMVRRCEADGQISVGTRPSRYAGGPIRLTPHALADLGLPMVVYLAWQLKMDDDMADMVHGRSAWIAKAALDAERDAMRGRELCRQLAGAGVVAVSPYLAGPWRCDRAALDAAAQMLAQRADAVIAVGSELLIGRGDVAAAHLSGVPISRLPEVGTTLAVSEKDLWLPPRLVPAYSQHSRAS